MSRPRWKIVMHEWHMIVGEFSCRIWRYDEPKFYWKVGSGGGWRASGHARTLPKAKLAVEKALNKLTIKPVPRRKR